MSSRIPIASSSSTPGHTLQDVKAGTQRDTHESVIQGGRRDFPSTSTLGDELHMTYACRRMLLIFKRKETVTHTTAWRGFKWNRPDTKRQMFYVFTKMKIYSQVIEKKWRKMITRVRGRERTRMGSCCLMSTEFQFKAEKFQALIDVMTALQWCECTPFSSVCLSACLVYAFVWVMLLGIKPMVFIGQSSSVPQNDMLRSWIFQIDSLHILGSPWTCYVHHRLARNLNSSFFIFLSAGISGMHQHI